LRTGPAGWFLPVTTLIVGFLGVGPGGVSCRLRAPLSGI